MNDARMADPQHNGQNIMRRLNNQSSLYDGRRNIHNIHQRKNLRNYPVGKPGQNLPRDIIHPHYLAQKNPIGLDLA